MIIVDLEVEPEPEDERQALPYLSIRVGDQVRRMLLDSGASGSTIAAPPGARTWPVRPTGTGVFGVGADLERRWRAPLQFDGSERFWCEVTALADGGGRELIGQDVLGRYRCHYQLDAGKLVLDGPPPVRPSPIHRADSGHVYLEPSWRRGSGPITGNAIFDTGASITVIDSAFAATHPELIEAAGTESGTDSSGTTETTELVELAGPEILGMLFTATPAAVVDLSAVNRTIPRPMDLILGWPLLRQADWIIDHPRRVAEVVPHRRGSTR